MLRVIQIAIFFFACLDHGVAQENTHLTKSVYFGGGSFYIDDIQIIEIMEFIKSIPNIEQHSITIHSHTDNIGGASYNEWLSEMRSNSTIYVLEELMIDRSLIEIQDFGQFNPVFDNTTPLGRMKNRRVDIIFWPISL